jgi:hypothetical protein
VVAASRHYPTLPDHLREAHNMTRVSKMVTASLAAFRVISADAWPAGITTLKEFCEDLRPDMQERVLKHGNPALTLRNYALRTPARQIPHRREMLLLLLLRHFAAYAAGKEIRAVQAHVTALMPLPYTPPKRVRKAA